MVYDPGAVALHFEFASSRSMEDAVRTQAEPRALFVRKHAERVAGTHPEATDGRIGYTKPQPRQEAAPRAIYDVTEREAMRHWECSPRRPQGRMRVTG